MQFIGSCTLYSVLYLLFSIKNILDDLDIAVVLRVDDAVFNFGNRQIICYRVTAGGLRLLGADRVFYFALLGDLLFLLGGFLLLGRLLLFHLSLIHI